MKLVPRSNKKRKGKKIVTINLMDEPTGIGFNALFLPGNSYDHSSPAHQYGRLLIATLHQELQKRGAAMEYEQGQEHVVNAMQDLPAPKEPSPIILPPGVRIDS